MQAGKLNRRITVQTRTPGKTPSGQPINAWQDVFVLWADVKTQTGMGVVRQSTGEDGVAKSLTSYSFRVRYRPSITNAMRVVMGGVVYDIKQVMHDHAGREWTDLACEQGGVHG